MVFDINWSAYCVNFEFELRLCVCVFWKPFTLASECELISRKLRNKTGSTGGSTGGADRQMSAIQDSLRTITGKLDGIVQLKQSIESINKDLWDDDGLDERIKYIGHQYENNSSEVESLRQENSYLRKELQVVINLDRRVSRQESEIIYQKGRSMRDNILIHGLEEEENEDLSKRVPMLIKEHLQLNDVGFIRIHRNGPRF